MTLRLYAERKDWPLGEVRVELSHERVRADDAPDPVDVIRSRIVVSGALSPEQSERLSDIAGKCPIHRLLLSAPRIVEEFVVSD